MGNMENIDALEFANQRILDLQTAASHLVEGEGSGRSLLIQAERAWDALIVRNSLRPDQTGALLSAFGDAVDLAVKICESGWREGVVSKAVVERIRFYCEAATIGRQKWAVGLPVDLDELRTIHKRAFAPPGNARPSH